MKLICCKLWLCVPLVMAGLMQHAVAQTTVIPSEGAVVDVITDDAQLPGEQDEGSFWSQFMDKEDNNVDLSSWLVDKPYGFLPVPLIITEPAIDNGLGLAAVYFHKPKEGDPEPEPGKFALPDVTAVAGAYTGNDSWFVGGGHFNTWKNDTRRYLGAIGYADINLDFFGSAGSESTGAEEVPPGGAPFNAKGTFIDQEVKFRAGASNWFIGGHWRYLNSQVKVTSGDPELDEFLTSDDNVSGLGLTALYENVNSNFSPTKGLTAEFEGMINDNAIGSDYDYEELKWKVRQYFTFAEKYFLSWRFDGSAINGDAPFYLEPYIELEGIPALRYQGETAATAEIRGGYNFNFRWSALAFAGGGRAAARLSDIGSEPTRTAIGAGFRYQLVRAFGLRVGLDVAKGPEDTYVYLIMGNAWN